MDLTLQKNSSDKVIKNYEDHRIYVDEAVYDHNLIISRDKIIMWDIENINNITFDSLSDALKEEPEILIIGTGEKSVLPDINLMNRFFDQGIGIEFMKTEAACKTFNVLASEDRRVIAALFV
tara:strand:- start:94 stop:459 length:366 start_codon:yes stop_codon:yes gene_type:complete